MVTRIGPPTALFVPSSQFSSKLYYDDMSPDLGDPAPALESAKRYLEAARQMDLHRLLESKGPRLFQAGQAAVRLAGQVDEKIRLRRFFLNRPNDAQGSLCGSAAGEMRVIGEAGRRQEMDGYLRHFVGLAFGGDTLPFEICG